MEDALPNGAAKRMYYPLFHAAQGLLSRHGVRPKTHRGVIAMVGEHLVKTGLVRPRFESLLAGTESLRLRADYEVTQALDDEIVEGLLAEVRTMIHEVEATL